MRNRRHTSKGKTAAPPPIDADRMTRNINTGLEFWAVCENTNCRRTRTCSGAAKACFERRWAGLGEKEKIWIRTAITARLRGLSSEEANAAAETEVARMREFEVALSQPPAACAPTHAKAPKTDAAAPVARVRQL
jgi:hypothetical protein